jgi:hypothetical protein
MYSICRRQTRYLLLLRLSCSAGRVAKLFSSTITAAAASFSRVCSFRASSTTRKRSNKTYATKSGHGRAQAASSRPIFQADAFPHMQESGELLSTLASASKTADSAGRRQTGNLISSRAESLVCPATAACREIRLGRATLHNSAPAANEEEAAKLRDYSYGHVRGTSVFSSSRSAASALAAAR